MQLYLAFLKLGTMKVNIFVCLSVFLISFFTISLNALAGQNYDHRTVILFEQDHHSES